MDLWAADVARYGGSPPFANHAEMYGLIDAIQHGDAPWMCLRIRYTGPRPEHNVPSWMDDVYEIWYRDPRKVAQNMLANPSFDGQIDYTAVRQFTQGGERRFCNLMSGNWSWRQSVSSPSPSSPMTVTQDIYPHLV